jgi:hypothetical protein
MTIIIIHILHCIYLRAKITARKNSISFLLIFVIIFILGGCASTGLTSSTHVTNVGLNNNNYQIVATSISGEASSNGIIGLSLGIGLGGGQFSIIPLSPNRTLYKNALQNLWANFEAKNGSAVGRTLALTNLRYDSETLNTVVYTKIKIVVIADVVEFK